MIKILLKIIIKGITFEKKNTKFIAKIYFLQNIKKELLKQKRKREVLKEKRSNFIIKACANLLNNF